MEGHQIFEFLFLQVFPVGQSGQLSFNFGDRATPVDFPVPIFPWRCIGPSQKRSSSMSSWRWIWVIDSWRRCVSQLNIRLKIYPLAMEITVNNAVLARSSIIWVWMPQIGMTRWIQTATPGKWATPHRGWTLVAWMPCGFDWHIHWTICNSEKVSHSNKGVSFESHGDGVRG